MVSKKQPVLAAKMTETDLIATDHAFSETQQNVLATLAELMIPAAGELPSAADAEILADVFDTLGDCGVPVTVFPGYGGLVDAVFPNNAFATRPGRLIIGSMCHPVRRGETAREDIRAYFRDVMGRELIDLSARPVIAE